MPTEHEGPPRYRLLQTIRQYGRERLAESGEEQRMQQRHHAFYPVLAESAADGWYGPGRRETLARLRAEHANPRAALDLGGELRATLALAAALRAHWCEGGFLGAERRRPDRELAAAPGPALWVLGHEAFRRGDLVEATVVARSALEKERGVGNNARVALMLEQLDWVTAARGDKEEAGRLLGAARTLWRNSDTPLPTFGPHRVEQHARREEDIARALGRAAYEKALAEGAGHACPDDAIAYAPRAEPEPIAPAPVAATGAALSPWPPGSGTWPRWWRRA